MNIRHPDPCFSIQPLVAAAARMKRIHLLARLAACVTTTLLVATAGAQQRLEPVPVEQFDIKTLPEPSSTPEPDSRPNVERRAPSAGSRTDAEPRATIPVRQERPARVEPPQMHYDEPGDGHVWARGTDYKVSFGPTGATYFPRLGPRAPRNAPHVLSPDVVTIGGQPIVFDRAVSAVRTGNRVELDRGAFVEAYDLQPGSMEQTFVFQSLPRTGEIVVHIPVASELEARNTGDGLEFRGEHGRVTYGRAVAVDANGRRSVAQTDAVDGAITIRVDPEFVSTCALPLVIDPVIYSFVVHDGVLDEIAPDVAWNPTFFCWLVAYEEVYSATDHDIRVRIMNYDGTVRHDRYVDFTTAHWTAPRCAGLTYVSQCLVVATRSPGTSSSAVVGREVGMLDLPMYSQITISRASDGRALNPVVGGDPYAGPIAYYCVAYERVYSATDHDILYRMVRSNNTLVGTGPTFLSNSGGTYDYDPEISKSNDTNDWMIVWTRDHATSPDIWGARVRWSGAVAVPPFEVANDPSARMENPAVSSPRRGTFEYVVAHERPYTYSDNVVIDVVLLRGTTRLSTYGAIVGESTNQVLAPSIDTDGERVVVVYGEGRERRSEDIFALEFLVGSDSMLRVVDGPVPLANSNPPEQQPRIAGLTPAGETAPYLRRDYVIAWADEGEQYDAPPGGWIEGAVYRGALGGESTTYCFGDGSSGNCPCGNQVPIGTDAGCRNSAGTGGALRMTGTASVSADTVVLTASGFPPSSSLAIFWGAGLMYVSPVPFGDGLLCFQRSLELGVVAPSNGVATFGFGVPGTNLVSIAGQVPPGGATRSYVVQYRDPLPDYCTTSAENVTNALSIRWLP